MNAQEIPQDFILDGIFLEDDEIPVINHENSITERGDIWLLGSHKLMCGDSTSIDDVNLLMSGGVADFGFCDPPYNIGFKYNAYNDNKTDEAYISFCHRWFSNLAAVSKRQAITLGTKNISIAANLAVVAGVACWIKKNWTTGCHIANLQQWEPIFFYGDYSQYKRVSDLFEINRRFQKDVGSDHTCPKQIELIIDIFTSYTSENELVVDLFCGSGTSIIACEKTKRICHAMELDPLYCDVIVKRWQNLTGLDAIHEKENLKFNEY